MREMKCNIEDERFVWDLDSEPKPPLQYHVEKFEDREPYEGYYRQFGYRPRTIYNDITDTFYKYMWENATTNIEIICNDIPPQIYKWMSYEIKIINK